MQLHRGTAGLPPFKNAVITIGTFDGVHKGHRKIIDSIVAEAKQVGGESVLITFDPHPRKLLQPDERPELINTIEEKTELLSHTGIDHLVVVPFTREFAALSAEAYISEFLIKNFHPHTIVIGYDHHYGRGRQGNFALLEKKSAEYGYRLIEIPKLTLDEVAISSTKIRKALLGGQVEQANKLLGYCFFFEADVIHGDKLGRQLGYPTANLRYPDPDKIRLAEGVYAAYAEVKGERKKGMLSIGNRPTIPGSDERVEINIFDFNGDIYGEQLRVIVKKYLRPQVKFQSLEELKAQMAKDRQQSLACL